MDAVLIVSIPPLLTVAATAFLHTLLHRRKYLHPQQAILMDRASSFLTFNLGVLLILHTAPPPLILFPVISFTSSYMIASTLKSLPEALREPPPEAPASTG